MRLATDMDKLPVEHLPFTVRIVKNPNDLQKVADLRQQAYARHIPKFAQQLTAPEVADTCPDTYVFLVESKDGAQEGGGRSLGTMRIHINRNHTLPLESTIQLPEPFQNQTLAEAVRFAIIDGQIGQQARNALFKAFYLMCVALKVEWMVICARPPVHKLYLGLLFEDISPDDKPVIMPHINNIPHRVLCMRVREVESLWYNAEHPLYQFIFETYHPDIVITSDDF